MVRKIIISLIVLIVVLLLTGCGKDEFKNDNVYVKPYYYTAMQGDTLDDIIGDFYKQNTAYVDWATYRQKHYDMNYHVSQHGRCLQPNDTLIIYTVHKKGNK